MNKNETGKDGELTVETENGTRTVPFTNADYEISYDISESEFNDSMEKPSAYTGKRASGTIEAEGSKAELKRLIMDEQGMPVEDIRIEIFGSEGGDRFTEVKIESFGREFPGGDKTTTEVPFQADKHRPINL